jgi:hypothetical protein
MPFIGSTILSMWLEFRRDCLRLFVLDRDKDPTLEAIAVVFDGKPPASEEEVIQEEIKGGLTISVGSIDEKI